MHQGGKRTDFFKPICCLLLLGCLTLQLTCFLSFREWLVITLLAVGRVIMIVTKVPVGNDIELEGIIALTIQCIHWAVLSSNMAAPPITMMTLGNITSCVHDLRV